jgi:hypothetical protein
MRALLWAMALNFVLRHPLRFRARSPFCVIATRPTTRLNSFRMR